ncbi:hypothetical protein evm_014706 [Chilo suppressalis]|nr:hypothetical protein evm_014706 [Chilo suppressalis]
MIAVYLFITWYCIVYDLSCHLTSILLQPERIDPPDPTRPDYDIRADVWSLGISLVELATGVFPYRDCQNDFEVLTRVIADDPPQLPDTTDFSPEFKSFVSQCLTKNYRHRPKYVKLLEHPFVVNSSRNNVSVGAWYASLPMPEQPRPQPTQTLRIEGGIATPPIEAPVTPQPVRNFVTSAHYWTPEQATPTPGRALWAASAGSGGSSSQPASLEADLSSHSPYPRRRTFDTIVVFVSAAPVYFVYDSHVEHRTAMCREHVSETKVLCSIHNFSNVETKQTWQTNAGDPAQFT